MRTIRDIQSLRPPDRRRADDSGGGGSGEGRHDVTSAPFLV
jgi:hypothetical protein